ncbi:VirB4-like conjugal transfer ATPase, CD1110 family [Butyricicoccus sp.]|uniref:VirB4-like conjugal transfer ATPase, CD1110 family n=1 Tax=Butyricicoccus sp. TaxID=2049021 RepID=UPI003D7D9851
MPLFKKSNPEKEKTSQNKKSKKQEERQFLTAQDSIFYQSMMQDGMCILGDDMYSRTYRFDDVNYRLNRRDDQEQTFIKFCEMYNYLDPETFFQILLVNRTGDSNNFMEQMFYPLHGDGYDAYRKEVNSVISKRGLEGNNNIVRDRFITFGLHSSDPQAVRQKLSRLETDTAQQFKAMGSNLHLLSGAQRLEVMSSLLKPDEPFDFTYDELPISGRSTKDFICPSSFDFKPVRTFQFGSKIGQILYASKFPDTLSDEVLCDISDLPINLAISLHVQAEDQNKALDYVRKQIAFMDQEASDKQSKASAKGYAAQISLSQEFQYNYEKALQLVHNMQYKDQHLFRATLLVFTYADTEDELKKNADQICAIARQKGVTLSTLDYEQEYGMNSILPLGRNFVQHKRTMTTAAVSIFMPFMAVELLEPGGINYGINSRSNALIAFDRTKMRASNGMILGTPGSGKGMFSKQELTNVFLNRWNDEIIIIDPEGEYAPLADVFHNDSEVLRIYGGSDTHLNPLDISENYGDGDDPLATKLDFICSFIELLSSSRSSLDGSDVSIIDRALHETYRDYLANTESTPMPTLVDFYNVLVQQPEQRAHAIALQLEAYITGSLNVFSYRTNVNTSKRLVVYDIKKLGKHLRTVGMLTVLDQVWNRITCNRERGIRTWVYIDEIQLLFSNNYCSEYFFELWSRARKWGAIPTGITQNVETLLLSDTARRMLSNSDFIVMLNQSRNDSTQLANLLNISPQQLSYMDNALPGHGLMFVEGRIVPFNSEFPKQTKLYAAMTTKLEEVAAQKRPQAVNSPVSSQPVSNSQTVPESDMPTLYPVRFDAFGCCLKTVDAGVPQFTEDGLSDVGFSIRSNDSDKEWTIRTGTDGTFVLHLPIGEYTVTPLSVPNGYLFDSNDASCSITVNQATQLNYALLEQSTKINFIVEAGYDDTFGLKKGRFIDMGLYCAEDIVAKDGTILSANSLIEHAEQVEDLQDAYIVETMLTGEFYLSPVAQSPTAGIRIPLTLHPHEYQQVLNLDEPIVIPIEYTTLCGKKVDEDGNALANVHVGLFSTNCSDFNPENAIVTTQADNDGKYNFSIPACLLNNDWKTRIIA